MIKTSGFAHLMIIVVALVALFLLVSTALIFKNSPGNESSGIPFLSNETKTSQVVVGMKTAYTNPFDKKTQYVNPFSGYNNPFDNLE